MHIEKIYDRFGDRMYHYLVLKLRSPTDAEDVLQEVFCRLVRYGIRWRLIRNHAAFVFKVARNEAHRFLKKRAKNPDDSWSAEYITKTYQENLVASDPLAMKHVTEALARIPEYLQEVIILKIFEELTFKEIAFICDISSNTAASRYRYGLKKMHELLEEGNEGSR
jgi:RNA polymerase sigma-70 factor (ECF subfamily)